MKIKNFEELATDEGRRAALTVVEAGFEAIDTEKVIASRIAVSSDALSVDDQKFSLVNIERIFVVGVGKCSLEAAAALEKKLGEKLAGGIVLDVRDGTGLLGKIESFHGTHPFPSQANVVATKKIIALLESLNEKDFVIFVISGGGSVLLCQPKDGDFEKEKLIIKTLFKKGAPIQEINTLRKHLSSARGGFLAQHTFGAARAVSLIFSDVPNNDLSAISSGPTVKDETTVADALAVAEKYGLSTETGFDPENLIETPKDTKYFEKIANILFLSNQTALLAMKAKAQALGFQTEICTSCLTGEARVVGKNIIEEIGGSPKRTAKLYAGETTVLVRGSGRGGRNQELALSALADVREGQYLISAASDGVDNGEYAGAICDTMGKKLGEKLGLNPDEFLAKNDSSEFFEKIGGCLKTGETGSNISDFVVALNI